MGVCEPLCGQPDVLDFIAFCNVLAGLCVMDLEDLDAMTIRCYTRPVVDYGLSCTLVSIYQHAMNVSLASE
ncbi:hypothetical protein BD414DRAFT_490869 [Trametes punicea]|nr:hypothetical protein BD414DRAFT_490869 [Trametes punicea]